MRFVISLVMCALMCVMACGPSTVAGAGDGSGSAEVIDCRREPQDAVIALIVELAPLLTLNSPDWSEIVARCARAGKVVGGCTIAMLVEGYRWPQSMQGDMIVWRDNVDEERPRAEAALEQFRRQHAGGAVFRTVRGDL